MKKLIYIFILIQGLLACNSNEKVSKEVFDEVNKSMKIKKLSEADITYAALQWGDSLSTKAQNQLMLALQDAIEIEGVDGAVSFCNIQALPILKELGDLEGVVIRRVSNRYRNPADQPLPYEQEIMEAYEYNAEQGIKNDPNIQKIKNGEVLLYTKAISIPGGLCLNCHGTPGQDIQDKTLQKIKDLYPDDKATGHAIGDLRGMWSISMPRKTIVKNM
jgi:hypothetical protein